MSLAQNNGQVTTALPTLPTGASRAVVDVHVGRALITLAKNYPTMPSVIEEMVQNAIDADAKKIVVRISWRTRQISVHDDGYGRTPTEFNNALTSVAHSGKEVGRLGRFGLGLISPLGKCQRYTFTSHSTKEPNSPYYEWTFVTDQIAAVSSQLTVPVRQSMDLSIATKPWWNTKIEIFEFTDDKKLSEMTLDSLEQGIRCKYREVLRRKKIRVTLAFVDENDNELEPRVIKPGTYGGLPLQDFCDVGTACGAMTVRMYVARQAAMRKLKNDEVNIGFGEPGDDHRVSLENFLKTSADGLGREVIEALRSGIFEGEVLAEGVELTPQRTGFYPNDALMELLLHLENWFEKVGKKHLKESKDAGKSDRYQNIGRQALTSIEAMLRHPDYAELAAKLRTAFAMGTIGAGHAPPANRVVQGVQKNKSKTTRGGAGKTQTPGDESSRSRAPTRKERKKDFPLSVQGEESQHRKLIKSNSVGLQLAYEFISGGSGDLWQLDRQIGLVTFNIGHPDFEVCNKKDSTLLALQEFVIHQIVVLENQPTDWYAQARLYADELTTMYVHWLTGSHAPQMIYNSIAVRARMAKAEAAAEIVK